MKRVLIVAYYFPPVAASGAMRPLAFSRFLGSCGWSPRVLTAYHSSVYPVHPVDTQLLAKLPSSVKVDAIRHGNPLQRMIALRDRWLGITAGSRSEQAEKQQAVVPEPVTRQGAKSGTLHELKEFLLDWGFAFPDPQCAWFRPAVAVAKKLSRTEVPHVVFATGGPWTSFLVGKHLAEFWGVPFIADYRDPWTSNPYVSFRSHILNEKARRLEQAVCEAASRVITNTHELRGRLLKEYPGLAGKALTITNGFDPEALVAGQATTDVQPAEGGRLEICHFGTVYGKRTPEVLLRVLLELHLAGKLHSRQLCLTFVGAWEVTDQRCEDLAQSLEKVGLLERRPPIPYQACLRQMIEADALLVIQPDSPLQIPGKIYEYIAARRPLLLVGGEGATANLVQRCRLGLACSNNPDSIRRMLSDVVERRERLTIPDQAEVDRFNYHSLTADLAKTLDEIHRAV